MRTTDYSHWSKDVIFVISDSHLDGMQAWLSAYHTPTIPSTRFGLVNDNRPHSQVDQNFERLSITSGVIWTALNIDYPGHSFSHLGVFRGTVRICHHPVCCYNPNQKDSMDACQTKTSLIHLVSFLSIRVVFLSYFTITTNHRNTQDANKFRGFIPRGFLTGFGSTRLS